MAEDHKTGKMGIIAVDAIFSPVVKANYLVKEIRVGKKKDMNELTMEVWTDGTVTPFAALKKAAEILSSAFLMVAHPRRHKEEKSEEKNDNHNLSLYLEELDLPLRLVNALKKAGYKKLADFEGMKKSELLKIKNVGEKSVKQLIAVLKKKGVTLEE